jgi:putative transposase
LRVDERRALVEPEPARLSIARQCEWLSLARSSYYYQAATESPENLGLMRLIDEQDTKRPFYGVERMTAWLREDKGELVNPKRVRRLMRVMGIEAIYPKPRLSQSNAEHRIYPYLLRDVKIERPNQVWSTEITYIRLLGGFVYLVAIIDWYSRSILRWQISNTLEVDFCLLALEDALRIGRPEIFNSDQGAPFTSREFTGRLERAGISISMDGRGRVFDNIFIERFWRTLKYEDIYLKDYEEVPALLQGVGGYLDFYNGERWHQSLGNRTPREVYFQAACRRKLRGLYADARRAAFL